MGNCSAIYGWQGWRREASAKPECSRATHAKLIEASGLALFNARKGAYAQYAKECRAWGREPMNEQEWFRDAKAAYCRHLRGG